MHPRNPIPPPGVVFSAKSPDPRLPERGAGMSASGWTFHGIEDDMKRLLASTAILLAASGPLVAQTAISTFGQTFAEGDMYGTNLIGQRLYVSEAPFEDGGLVSAEVRGEWDDVGEIDDMLIAQDGQIKAVLLDIGGFLGIGERTVAVDMSTLHFLVDEDDPGDVFVAINGTEEELENAPAFERPDLPGGITQTDAGATTAVIPVETTAEENNAEMTADQPVEVQVVEPEATEETVAVAPVMAPVDENLRLARPEMAVEGYQPVEREALTAETLIGAEVWGSGEEEIGEVADLVLGADGQIEGAVIDVGGWLGIGEHPVAVSFDEMQIVQGETGEMRVYIEASEEKLEARPVHAG